MVPQKVKWVVVKINLIYDPVIQEEVNIKKTEKVYLRSQILERPSIDEYWNISGVPILPEKVI